MWSLNTMLSFRQVEQDNGEAMLKMEAGLFKEKRK